MLKILEYGVADRGDFVVGVTLKVDKTKPQGHRIVQSNVDPARIYKVACPQAYIVEPPRKPVGIRNLLKELGVKATETKDTVTDLATAYAKKQKVLVPPAGSEPAKSVRAANLPSAPALSLPNAPEPEQADDNAE